MKYFFALLALTLGTVGCGMEDQVEKAIAEHNKESIPTPTATETPQAVEAISPIDTEPSDETATQDNIAQETTITSNGDTPTEQSISEPSVVVNVDVSVNVGTEIVESSTPEAAPEDLPIYQPTIYPVKPFVTSEFSSVLPKLCTPSQYGKPQHKVAMFWQGKYNAAGPWRFQKYVAPGQGATDYLAARSPDHYHKWKYILKVATNVYCTYP